MRLLLLGCSGFIGKELVPILLNSGHQITLVSRKAAHQFANEIEKDTLKILQLNPADPQAWANQPLLDTLKRAEGVINLAGEPIADKRWTQGQCMKIKTSRLNTTKALIDSISKLKKPPRVLVNGSAIGYYGTSQSKEFTEDSNPGNDFLANLCNEWEAIASQKPRATRLTILRIGIVIGPNGGALGKMLPVFRAGLGGPIGNGRQWMSWIHRTDLCQLIAKALTNQAWHGVINGVAPEPISMGEFASSLGNCLGRPSLFPVPGPLLKLILGDGAKVVLEGQNVKSRRLQELRFNFKYPNLNQALSAATAPNMN